MNVKVTFTRKERKAFEQAIDLLNSEADSMFGYSADDAKKKRLYEYAEVLRAILTTGEQS